MDPKLSLTLVGLSHRTTSVDVRERYVVKQEDVAACVRTLLGAPGVREAFVLSTCNRTEVLVVGEAGRELASAVRSQVFRNAEDAGLYTYADIRALIHFFRVAAGLDSLVVGESEILGQIKRGMELAQAERALGPTLQALLQQALHVGKRVRSETQVGQGTLSVARVGVEVARRAFGHFEKCSALIVGAGETGQLVARHLRDQHIEKLAFANRTLERAEVAARELGGRAFPLAELGAAIAHSDLVVSCVEAGEFTIEPGVFDRRALKRRDRPLLVIDLSIPRSVDPSIAKLPNVLRYDLDDLAKVVHGNQRERDLAVEGTAEILVAELHKFLSLRAYAAFGPTIAAMRERFEKVREDVLDQVAGARSDPRDLQLAHELTKRLLDSALFHLKEGARSVRSEETLDREYQRFLDELG